MGDMDEGFGDDEVIWSIATAPKRRRKASMADLIDEAEKASRKQVSQEDMLFDAVEAYLGDSVFAQRFVQCMEIIRRKNADYSQGEEKRDRIAAFKRISRDVEMPVRKVWAVFAQKHWGAIMRYIKDGFVESEPIDGRINDMINYLVLLGAIVDYESPGKAEV